MKRRKSKMNEEVLRITKLLEEGKINAEQAAALIDALNGGTSTPKAEQLNTAEKRAMLEEDMVSAQIPGQKMLQVRVLSENGDKVKVNLPLNFVRGILKATGKMPMIKAEHMEGVDMEQLMESITLAIDHELNGRIVDVESANGDLVIVDIVNGHA
jgi:hypothetical protein